MEGMVARRRLGGSVVMTGSVPWDEVPPLLDAGDVFAMPCRSRMFGLEVEAFGTVYLEAAAVGLTVLAGRSGGAAEAVRAAAQLPPKRSEDPGRILAGILGSVPR
jgi:phosphatidylinositol alpha-1,6-mannosyltransferase